MRSGLDQRGDRAKNSRTVSVTWLMSTFFFTEWPHRETCEHTAGTGNTNNNCRGRDGAGHLVNGRLLRDHLSFNTYIVKVVKNLGPAVKDEEEWRSGWLQCGW